MERKESHKVYTKNTVDELIIGVGRYDYYVWDGRGKCKDRNCNSKQKNTQNIKWKLTENWH